MEQCKITTLCFTFQKLLMVYMQSKKSSVASRAIQPRVYASVLSQCFLTRELRACARASYRYDVGNSIRSLARLVDSRTLFFFRF